MDPIQWKTRKVIDAHVHFRYKESLEHFKKILSQVNYTKINILHGPDNRQLPKEVDPQTTYMFRMPKQDPNKIAAHDGEYLVQEVDAIMSNGFDGIKMMDGKPAMRRTWQPLRINDDYFKPYWDKVEADHVPVTIHVNDPVDSWDPKQPDSYHGLDTQEEFFQQALAVLKRNPNLRINFAHFFFMGPQLNRLGDLFAKYSNMRVDLALGPEFLFYLSDDPVKAREFCIRWSDRIIYGTDINDGNSLRLGRAKAETLHKFLETDETFHLLTAEASGLPVAVGSNGRSELHGLDLPMAALDNIMWRNFETFVAPEPKPLTAAAKMAH